MHFVKVVLGFTKLTRGFGEKYILFEKPVKMRRKKFMVKEKPATGACVMVMFCKGTVASPSIVDWTIVCFISLLVCISISCLQTIEIVVYLPV